MWTPLPSEMATLEKRHDADDVLDFLVGSSIGPTIRYLSWNRSRPSECDSLQQLVRTASASLRSLDLVSRVDICDDDRRLPKLDLGELDHLDTFTVTFSTLFRNPGPPAVPWRILLSILFTLPPASLTKVMIVFDIHRPQYFMDPFMSADDRVCAGIEELFTQPKFQSLEFVEFKLRCGALRSSNLAYVPTRDWWWDTLSCRFPNTCARGLLRASVVTDYCIVPFKLSS
ncbi:uncharacterized protein FIBRA_06443 [Fibroporia radiculosa]|uniref:Uncharacterized protein n=1 Tax=Fibroporia radiculosa TaxID=599839 RepID=J4HZ42_9APHY|nr:uncharacterized protein FIBRA_06443 [Fibroporia radiculosa]CCM04272.1 predicted protein [Fibroporia radiculosa]